MRSCFASRRDTRGKGTFAVLLLTMGDANVQAYLKKEADIARAQTHVKYLREQEHGAQWAETQAKRGNTQAEKQRQEQRMKEEMTQASRELKTRRRERLRMLYAALEERYEKELAEKGLAFIRDRD